MLLENISGTDERVIGVRAVFVDWRNACIVKAFDWLLAYVQHL